MKFDARRPIKAIFWVSVFYYLLTDLLARLRSHFGDISTTSGTIHGGLSVADSVSYIEEVFDDYKQYSKCQRFSGRVAEVGPGDSCGVALLFLNDGCERVDLVDRFFSRRNLQSQAAIYEKLISRHSGLGHFLRDADLGDEKTLKSLERHYGANAAAETFFAKHVGYDFIVSRAALEHLYDPLEALKCMAAALRPGGYMLHKIDLRDHGMFSVAHHELKFLEIPEWLYPWLTSGSGRPNRVLVDKYRDSLKCLNIQAQLLVTRLVGVGDIHPHLPYEDIPPDLRAKSATFVKSMRKRFASKFRSVSDEDLSVAGVFIVARKLGDRGFPIDAQPVSSSRTRP